MSWNIRKNNVNKTVHNRFTKIESFAHFSISVTVAQNSQQLRDKNMLRNQNKATIFVSSNGSVWSTTQELHA